MRSWSPQQDQALREVNAWLRNPGSKRWFYLAGYAGTGKTTLAMHLAGGVRGDVIFGAYTGKAALVMQHKGCDGAATLHSHIYRLEEEGWGGEPKFVINAASAIKGAGLVIVDEVSMVGEELARDLLSFRTPVLVLGDPEQLPPVKKSEGFFTANEPDFMLTEVHRQARDNPIIAMSMDVREGRGLRHGTYGDSRVIGVQDVQTQDVLDADQVLVGKNLTRQRYNARIRHLRGFDGELPVKGERLICLKNNRQNGLLNGQMWEVEKAEFERKRNKRHRPSAEDVTLSITDEMTGRQLETRARIEDFLGKEIDLPWQEIRDYDRFDYCYAITTHKSQGSQWDNVYVFDESSIFREHKSRWLYTAITRAAERITLVM